jgi:hypothetical protein
MLIFLSPYRENECQKFGEKPGARVAPGFMGLLWSRGKYWKEWIEKSGHLPVVGRTIYSAIYTRYGLFLTLIGDTCGIVKASATGDMVGRIHIVCKPSQIVNIR